MLPSSLHFAVTNRPQQGCLATLLNATEAARWVLGPVILMSSPGTDAPQIRSDHGSGLTHGPTGEEHFDETATHSRPNCQPCL